ncbi:unnamed protein product [Acanthoscelides obtectus]|uniref:Uncharacterized protein n=1 Tax=Acanthoscelides obtectus TaxID=200917 RepID=A0A9P0NUW0_ACAOB|nr:unnamed protein product [Acanthoscelides obtectus]CAK1642895.1 hypothetical protein AOBTE_LOCUS13274 [Acanthoscelides obtectus]
MKYRVRHLLCRYCNIE